MEKQKRQTLNADKRKVIAAIFQQHFEDNSKYKKQHSEATPYQTMKGPIGLGRYARHALGIILGETYQKPLYKEGRNDNE